MQKTVLFGINQENAPPSITKEGIKHACSSCLRFQTQLSDLRILLADREQEIKKMMENVQNQALNIMKTELIDIKQKYSSLKKKVKQIEKQNDELFTENGILQKQISSLRMQIKQYQSAQKDTTRKSIPKRSNDSDKKHYSPQQIDQKQKQVQHFVSSQKIKNLQSLLRNQSDQILKLKEYIKKRENQQSKRHKLLQNFKFS